MCGCEYGMKFVSLEDQMCVVLDVDDVAFKFVDLWEAILVCNTFLRNWIRVVQQGVRL